MTATLIDFYVNVFAIAVSPLATSQFCAALQFMLLGLYVTAAECVD
jgi:hypothetical protein